MTICDNNGNIIAPLVTQPVNCHDTHLFKDSLDNLIEISSYLNLDIEGSFLTLDSGFNSAANKKYIFSYNLFPIIKPNLRGLKDRKKINKILDEFESLKFFYQERYKIERCFAWEDKYRKLVIRYETLPETFLGFRYLAFTMINFRSCFKSNF